MWIDKLIRFFMKKPKRKIIKWKPQIGDFYYIPEIEEYYRDSEVSLECWEGSDLDIKRYNSGMCFKTKSEAAVVARRLYKESINKC